MTEKIKIVGIRIKCPNGELSLEEAKALYNELDKLFGKKVEYIPSRPIVIERDRWPWQYYPPVIYKTTDKTPLYEYPTITCKSTSLSLLSESKF